MEALQLLNNSKNYVFIYTHWDRNVK